MSDVDFTELSFSDRLVEAIRGIKAAAVEHGVGDEVGAAIALAELIARTPPTAANAPSSEWMAAVANRAIDRVCALLGTSLSTRTRGEIVKHALAAPPPAGPGGPNG